MRNLWSNKSDITEAYGESGLGNPEGSSALAPVVGTELIWGGGSAAASTLGSGLASVGAGRDLPVVVGSKATPICWVSHVDTNIENYDHGKEAMVYS